MILLPFNCNLKFDKKLNLLKGFLSRDIYNVVYKIRFIQTFFNSKFAFLWCGRLNKDQDI